MLSSSFSELTSKLSLIKASQESRLAVATSRMAVDPQLARDVRIQRTCLDLMYDQTRTAWVSNVFCVFLLWVAFWENANHAWLLGWTVAGVVLMALREVQSSRYASRAGQPINLLAWTRWLEFSLLANGCLWGVGCAALALVATPYQLTVILLIAAGLQTGSVLVSSYLLSAFTLFSLPLFLFILVAFLLLGFNGHPSLLVTSALLVVWSLFVFMCARRFAKHYQRFLGFSLDNIDLADSLQSKYQENEDLNQSLQNRIDELNATQRQLLIEKNRSDGLVEQLRKLSMTDGLTGLANRRCFDESLQSEWRRALRNRQPIALVFADVDHFKSYNDQYGHQMGDECLITVGGVLAAAVRREGDWVARYGGEEFALIFANTSLEDATVLAERIRQDLIARAVEHSSSSTAPYVTMSLGVVGAIPDSSLEPELLLAAADEALYAAKQNGRNKVVTRNALDRTRKQLA